MEHMLSEKGKPLIVYEGFKFRLFRKTDMCVMWRCTVKTCSAKLNTDCTGSVILESKPFHDHPQPKNLLRDVIRNSVKRKAVEDMTEMPTNLIWQEIAGAGESFSSNVSKLDVRSFNKAIGVARRNTLLPLSTPRMDLHEALNSIVIDVDSEIASQLNWSSMTTSMKRARKSATTAGKEPQEGLGTTSIESAPSAAISDCTSSQDPEGDISDESTMGHTSHIPSSSSHPGQIPVQNQVIDGKRKRNLPSTITSSDLSQTTGTSNTDAVKVKPINTLQEKHSNGKTTESKTKDNQTSKVDINVNSLESAIKRLESVSDKLVDITILDCYDQFGKYISSILRGLPEKEVNSLKQKIMSEITKTLTLAYGGTALQGKIVPKDVPTDLTSELRANYRRKFATEQAQGENLPPHSTSAGSQASKHGNMPIMLTPQGSPVLLNPMACGSSSTTTSSVGTISSDPLTVPEEGFFKSENESSMASSIPKTALSTPFESDHISPQSRRARKRRKTTANHTTNKISSPSETEEHTVTTCSDDSSADEGSVSFTNNRTNEEQEYDIDIKEGNELAEIKKDSDLFETVLCGETSSLYIKEEVPDPEEALEGNYISTCPAPANHSATFPVPPTSHSATFPVPPTNHSVTFPVPPASHCAMSLAPTSNSATSLVPASHSVTCPDPPAILSAISPAPTSHSAMCPVLPASLSVISPLPTSHSAMSLAPTSHSTTSLVPVSHSATYPVLPASLSVISPTPTSLSAMCHICNIQCASMEDLIRHFTTTHPGCPPPTIVVSEAGYFMT